METAEIINKVTVTYEDLPQSKQEKFANNKATVKLFNMFGNLVLHSEVLTETCTKNEVYQYEFV